VSSVVHPYNPLHYLWQRYKRDQWQLRRSLAQHVLGSMIVFTWLVISVCARCHFILVCTATATLVVLVLVISRSWVVVCVGTAQGFAACGSMQGPSKARMDGCQNDNISKRDLGDNVTLAHEVVPIRQPAAAAAAQRAQQGTILSALG